MGLSSKISFWAIMAAVMFAVTSPGAVVQAQQQTGMVGMSMAEFVRAMPENGRFVLLRSYLPADGRENVKLPKIIVKQNGQRHKLPECPWQETSNEDFFKSVDELASKNWSIKRFIRKLAKIIHLKRTEVAPYCAWWVMVTPETLNIAFPDSAATYWATPFLADEDTEIIIKGEYGDMRYMSLAIYDQKFSYYEWSTDGELCPEVEPDRCFGTYITDYQIDPMIGGTNPFRNEKGDPSAKYKVILTPTPQHYDGNALPTMLTKAACLPGQKPCNTMESEPEDRNYLFPQPCDDKGSLSPCPVSYMTARPTLADQTGVVENPDNTYLPSQYDARDQVWPLNFWKPGKVFIARGKLPITPLDMHPVVWPNKDYDMRYWSMCSASYIPPYPSVTGDNACVADLDVRRTNVKGIPDENGQYFTIVFSTEENKPDLDYEALGINWVKATDHSIGITLNRNMLVSSDFKQSGFSVPFDGSWASLYNVMGEYYPMISVICTKDVIEEYGWGRCVAPKLPDAIIKP
ncbi:MAG: hypothetical protein GY762_23930 [Proteobacteria bacterium]|nr:hypothetical protein [Pseudomonadota bacterium]